MESIGINQTEELQRKLEGIITRKCPYSMVQIVCGLTPTPEVCRRCLKEMAGTRTKSQGKRS